MAGGGLALMTFPALTDATSWRAPYWTAIVLCVVAACRRSPPAKRPRRRTRERAVLDRRLLPLGAVSGCHVRAQRGRRELGRHAARAGGRKLDAGGHRGRSDPVRRHRSPARRAARPRRHAQRAPAAVVASIVAGSRWRRGTCRGCVARGSPPRVRSCSGSAPASLRRRLRGGAARSAPTPRLRRSGWSTAAPCSRSSSARRWPVSRSRCLGTGGSHSRAIAALGAAALLAFR